MKKTAFCGVAISALHAFDTLFLFLAANEQTLSTPITNVGRFPNHNVLVQFNETNPMVPTTQVWKFEHDQVW